MTNRKPKDKLRIKRRFKKTLYLIVILCLVLLSLDRATHFKCNPAYTNPKERDEALLEYYDYPKNAFDAKVKKLVEREKYVIKRIEFPSTVNVFGEDNNIRIDYYEQKEDGTFPTILIFPILGGVTFPVKSFANYFASNGFNCAIVRNKKFKIVGDLEETENFFRQSIIDNRQVIEYLVHPDHFHVKLSDRNEAIILLNDILMPRNLKIKIDPNTKLWILESTSRYFI